MDWLLEKTAILEELLLLQLTKAQEGHYPLPRESPLDKRSMPL
jgi:hypothetical protein